MRADAARNLDAVLHTGARLLAEDSGTSIARIAAEAGVDRRTVYRRFTTRESLLAAVYQAKLDASEEALDQARLTEAPVAVALHRYVESIIPVSRRWPLDIRRLMQQDPEAHERAEAQRARLAAFVRRAADEGLVRSDLPDGWAMALLGRLVDNAAHDFLDLAPGPAADLVVATFLEGVGGPS
ncbi:TetR family transcriptional regulator [Streptomyces sulfonofaciens]|uniref:TetR family transcriptional regulator n=1 Tax=Streptomyces sulfonofaciens TaxID=68272 RepID=A0A919GEY6_9ACTN|nr:TetR/AcrR family transcriptional regulator [Streptomyces sulfonofaciens]GHH83617.1 TetR family transcriptional regulator [Streptomyces sulfonofaciens]